MSYQGDIVSHSTLYFAFTSRKSTGLPTSLLGNPSLSVYKDNNAVETAVGVSLTVDHDTKTGLNLVEVITTDSFYATSTDYTVVITAGTVDSISVVGEVVGSFSIENRYNIGTNNANTTTPPTVTQIRTEMDTNSTKLSNLDVAVSTRNSTTPPTSQAITNQVWDELTSAHILSGSTAKKITDIPTTPMRGTDGAVTDKVGYTIAGTKTTLDALNDIASSSVVTNGAINTTAGAVDNVTTVTTNTDMRGTDNANTTTPPTITQIRTEMDTNSTKLSNLDVAVSTRNSTTPPTSQAIATSVHDEVFEGSFSLRQLERIVLAVLANLSTGGGTSTLSFRDLSDAKDRVTATVDANGNRTAITLDGT